jgi:hypothetical protein
MSATLPKFSTTRCSQCGGEFGAGDSGYSHCEDHDRAGATRRMRGCAVCGKVNPHRGPEGCDRVLPEPACDACSDTGRVAVWKMGWHGYDEVEEKCKHCSVGEDK